MEELTITVAQPTADILHKVSEESGTPIGELVDRLALAAAPYNPDIAFLNILEQYLICVSRLNKEDCAKVFGDICGIFLGCIPPEDIDEMVLRVKSMYGRMRPAPEPMTEEELAELRKSANQIFRAEGDENAWKIFSAFLRGA